MRGSRVLKNRGVVAAIVAVVGTIAVGVAGAAGASSEAAPATIYALDTNGQCFTGRDATSCESGETGDVDINTGDAVTWNFDRAGAPHNAASTNDVPTDPTWEAFSGAIVTSGSYSRTFNKPGIFTYHCDVHPGMTGTISVTGDPIETQTPTPSITATATTTATATPSTQPSDPGTSTPPPTGGTQDLLKPTLRSFAAKGKRRAITVSFRLSENATVFVRVKRGSRVVKSVSKQLAAGKRSVSVRSSKLRKGRYKIEVRARDASGNVSTLASKSLRIRK
jgi:plastocyanin